MNKLKQPVFIPRLKISMEHIQKVSIIESLEKYLNDIELKKGEEKTLKYNSLAQQFNVSNDFIKSLMYPLTLNHYEVTLFKED